MGLRVHVRIHADRDRGHLSEGSGHAGDVIQLRNAFDIEAVDALFERESDFLIGLADAGINDLRQVAARGLHAQEFAARHDVEPGTELREQADDADIRARLHGVKNVVRMRAKRAVVVAEGGLNGLAAVDEGWGAILVGEFRHGNVLTEERAVPIGKARFIGEPEGSHDVFS